jgi:23S rRNA pseudouridine1911/1915/1917 synthase
MTQYNLNVVYEDNHLLVVNKPAGLPTAGVPEGRDSLLEVARQYVIKKYNKPGNAFIGIVSRLDAPVSGIVLMARTSKAAARLSEQFRERRVRKIYWAQVAGRVKPAQGAWTDWLEHDERHRRMRIAEPEAEGAREGRLSYRRLSFSGDSTRLEINLETGRKHQIRLQAATHGYPILGDRKYGSRFVFPQGIALHSRLVEFEHPVKKTLMKLDVPVPKSWRVIDDSL